MGKLGGSILGHDGLSALQKEPGLAIGEGLEGDSDGGGTGAGVDDLLINDGGDHLLINDTDTSVRKIND